MTPYEIEKLREKMKEEKRRKMVNSIVILTFSIITAGFIVYYYMNWLFRT